MSPAHCVVTFARVHISQQSATFAGHTSPFGTVAEFQTAHLPLTILRERCTALHGSLTTSGISVELQSFLRGSILAATSGDFHRCLTAHRLGKYSSKKLTLTLR